MTPEIAFEKMHPSAHRCTFDRLIPLAQSIYAALEDANGPLTLSEIEALYRVHAQEEVKDYLSFTYALQALVREYYLNIIYALRSETQLTEQAFKPLPLLSREAPYYLVWAQPGTMPRSYNSPSKKHPTFEEAEQEALRLGRECPAGKVFVLAPVAEIKTQVTVTAHAELL